MIFSHVKISIISLTSGLSLKLYLNSLVYHRNIFRSSSKVLGKCSGTFVWSSGQFEKSSEGGRKSSENHQKCRHQYVYIIKRILHVSSKIWILCSRGKRYCSCHSNIKFISSRHRVIFSLSSCVICVVIAREIFLLQSDCPEITKVHSITNLKTTIKTEILPLNDVDDQLVSILFPVNVF